MTGSVRARSGSWAALRATRSPSDGSSASVRRLNSGIKELGPADTYWANDIALQTVNGWLSTDPDIKGYAYEYADGLNTACRRTTSSGSR